MLKLQLVLSLILSIQFEAISGRQLIPFIAKLKDIYSDITPSNSIGTEKKSYFYEQDDIHDPTDGGNQKAVQIMDSPNDQLNNLIESENNDIKNDGNPEEGDELEGDLLMPPGYLHHSLILKTGNSWPGGLVPYELDGPFTKAQIRQLLYAFDQYSAKTCIKFYPRTIEEDYVAIVTPAKGCASNVGRIGGRQTLNLAYNCFYVRGTIMHELMHVLGFLHEQNRYDRDEYVKIIYENLLPGNEINFKKFTKEETTNLGIPYDYGSVMHYVDNGFTKNGKTTIMALKRVPDGVKMGQRDGFSHYDLEKINRKYQCDNRK